MSKEESKTIKIGNTVFIKESLQGMTKEFFMKTYKGKLNSDLGEAWKKISRFTKVKS